MNREQAQKELNALLQEAEQCDRYYTLEECQERLERLLDPRNVVYMTGDTHGRMERIEAFCKERDVKLENTFIILGDAGLNYWGDSRDVRLKEKLARIPITFFCLHGNHEMRPGPDLGYELSEYHGGKVWVEPKFPNILFAIDGEVYDFCGHSCLVIGGAYSVDKWYRLERGFGWWSDEQPSQEIKDKVERVLDERGWDVDIVLSHTCPEKYEPREVFLPMIDQSTVDKSTEQWLGEIEDRLHYERWYCGHYHTEKKIDKLRLMFNDYTMIPRILSISDEEDMIRRVEHQAAIVQALGLLSDNELEGDQE